MSDANRSRFPLLVITGATATGKTSLAVDIAHQLSSEIISADSRQVYRGLDIGTGKDLADYAAVDPPVPYHLIDIVEAETVYTLYHFQRDCYRLLEAKRKISPFCDGVPLLLVGGTPLYIASVLLNYRIPNVPEDSELRRTLEQQELPDLVEQLRHENAEVFEKTDLTTKRRVVRALEIAAHARRGTLQETAPLPFDLVPEVFVMRVDRKEIHRRIDRRLRQRLEEGMVEEVRDLLDRGITRERMEQLGLEYRELSAYIHGDKSYGEMVHDLEVAIHRFARRQEIWFRGFERRGISVTWIEPNDREAILTRAACL